MKWKEEDLETLRNLETSVVKIWRVRPELTDYAALRGYEAAYKLYREQLRGHLPKPHALKGLDADVFESIHAACEIQLGRRAGPATEPGHRPVTLEKLVEYLRELGKSVERHTQLEGRQGYLNFIDRYLR